MAKKPGKIDALVEKALNDELKEVTRRHSVGHDKAGEFVYSSVERMRVIDRVLKLQSIKLKASDPEWGAAFGAGDDD